jgi:hypothetical protein
MIINYDGKVGINTSSPSEQLEVAGNVKATSFIVTPAQTRHVSFSGEVFQSFSSSYTASKTGGQLYSATALSWWNVPLNLPDGAVITKLSLTYWDNSSSNVAAKIWRISTIDGTQAMLASFTTSSVTAAWQVGSTTTITTPTIDNSLFAYEVTLDGFDGTPDIKVAAVVIEYTVTSPMP